MAPGADNRGVHAILWDMDGTILDSTRSIQATLQAVLSEQDLPLLGDRQVANAIGRPLREILAWRSTDADAIAFMVRRYRELYTQKFWRLANWHDGFPAILHEVVDAGFAQALVTSKGQTEAEHLLRSLGIDNLFAVVIGDNDRRPLKPDPAPVLAACADLGIEPGNSTMVGDTRFDADSAIAAGAQAVVVSWGHSHDIPLGAKRVDTPDELRRLLFARAP